VETRGGESDLERKRHQELGGQNAKITYWTLKGGRDRAHSLTACGAAGEEKQDKSNVEGVEDG